MMAIAFDAEEDQQYNDAMAMAIAFNNPKALKKWKRGTGGKMGTRSVDPTDTVRGLASALVASSGSKPKAGSGVEFAKATGRPIVYYDDNGFMYDENMNPLAERTPYSVLVKLDKEVQH
jgi:hypothetical protein